MQPDARIAAISHVIQLAIAPVFMLTGIASLLGVLTNRFARIIDRARLLEGHVTSVTGEHRVVMTGDLTTLRRRARKVIRAIGLCTTAALLVCVLIALLFISAVVDRDASDVVAVLFVLAMLTLIAGLVSFLQEIQLAIRSLRIGGDVPRG